MHSFQVLDKTWNLVSMVRQVNDYYFQIKEVYAFQPIEWIKYKNGPFQYDKDP